MRRTVTRIDRAVWIVLLLSIVAAWPFIFRSSLPRETDAELHVFRAAELGYSLRTGVMYPRWAPDFYYGYGYPIFNYYAPLTYYLANLFSLALPGGAVFGVKMVFVAGFILAGQSVYSLAAHRSGPAGGIIAASSYLFAPYIYLIDPHLRGDLAEFFALASGPLSLAAYAAFMEKPNKRLLVVCSLTTAAMITTHNLLALVYFGLLVGYWLSRGLWNRLARISSGSAIDFARYFLPLLIGLMLSAFFWLPVALERDAVRLGNLIGPGHFDFRTHFLRVSDLLGLTIPLDLGAANPEFRFNLGVAQWGLGLLGVAAVIWLWLRSPGNFRRVQPYHSDIVFWTVALAILAAMMLPMASALWDTIPILPYFQFPWRLLGPAVLFAALLGSQLTRLNWVASNRWAGALLAAVPLLFALPAFVPPGWRDFGPTDQKAMLDFELDGRALGTTSTGDFVPSTVDVVPGPSQSLLESYGSGGPIDKVNRATLPPGTMVTLLKHGPISDTFQIETDQDFVLRIYTFMFKGWKATLDGRPVAIEIARPEGFITVSVPSGAHVVNLRLGATPARTIGNLVSVLGVLTLIIVRLPPVIVEETTAELSPVSSGHYLAVVGGCLLMVLLGSPLNVFQPRSEGITIAPPSDSLHVFVEGGIDLLGYRIEKPRAYPGDSIDLTLFWKAREQVYRNYQVFVHLNTTPEHTWAQSDKLNPGDYPTSRWPLDKYVRDHHQVMIPPGTPPGEYRVSFGLWDHRSGVRQLILEQDGTIVGDAITLPQSIMVYPARREVPVDKSTFDFSNPQEVAPGIVLVGGQMEPDSSIEFERGLIKLILYWQAKAENVADYDVLLRISDVHGSEYSQYRGKPADGNYPTIQWPLDTLVRDIYTFVVDGSYPAGTYQIEIAMSVPGEKTTDWIKIIDFDRGQPPD